MGWKASMILINSEKEFNTNEFFESLGYIDLKKVDVQPFEAIMNPDNDRIYTGKFNGNTIICLQDLPLDSMDESLSLAESTLSNKFPGSEIATFVLHSVVNLWGYAVVKNGKKIRARMGSSEDGTILDFGEVLEEEKELYGQSKLTDEGKRIFILDDLPEEEFQEDQIGENFVFDISMKYLGESLDGCEELDETQFEGFSFRKVSKQITETPVVVEEAVAETPVAVEEEAVALAVQSQVKKPWWKFW